MPSNNRYNQTLYMIDVPEPVIAKNTISGSVNEITESDKSVWLYDRTTGELLASTMIDKQTRTWTIGVDENHTPESLFVVCLDEGGEYNGDIYDRVSLCSREVAISGISNAINWAETILAKEVIIPNSIINYLDVNLQELKGNVAKVVEDDTSLKFVDSNDAEVTNAALEDIVVVNDNTVIKNKGINTNLLSWKKNIFNDGSEVFHPVLVGETWQDHYTGRILQKNVSATPTSFGDVTPGKYGEPAIYAGYAHSANIRNSTAPAIHKRGSYVQMEVGNTNALSVSFFYYHLGATAPIDKTHRTTYQHIRLLNICWGFPDIQQRRGIASNFINTDYYSGDIITSNDKIVGINYNTDTTSGKYVNTTITDEMYGGSNFTWLDKWHHVLFVVRESRMFLYIDGHYINELTHTNASIPSSVALFIGMEIITETNGQMAGIYSGLRVFNREILQSEIPTLLNDTPRIDTEVNSIKAIEYDSGLLSLAGGVPYKPLFNIFPYVETSATGILNGVFATDNIDTVADGSAPVLGSGCVRFFYKGGSTTEDISTSLSTLPSTVETEDLGFNLNDIEVYIRLRLLSSNAGYILTIGNRTNGSVFIYTTDTTVQLRRSNVGTPVNLIAKSGVLNKWIRIRLTQGSYSVYDDTDTVSLASGVLTNKNFANSTKGQVCVGSKRAGSSAHAVGDGHVAKCDVSDVVIYQKDTMGTNAPVVYKEFHFGYDRDGLAGLNVSSNWNLMTVPNIDNSGLAFIGRSADSATNVSYAGIELSGDIINAMDLSKGYSVSSYVYNDKNYVRSYTEHMYVFRVPNMFAITMPYKDTGFRISNQAVDSKGTTITNSHATKLANVFDKWQAVGMTWYKDICSERIVGYANGYPFGSAVTTNYTQKIPSSPVIEYRSSNGRNKSVLYNGRFDKIRLYNSVLPKSCWRNIYQNYSEKVCSNKMQVAIFSDNNEVPLYKGLPITKISISGNTNGQTLTFALSQGENGYFIYSDTWKKIAGNEGGSWKYLNGSSWSVADNEHDALAKAMDISSNHMTLGKINSLNAQQIEEFYDMNIGKIDIAVGMKSNGNISPYVDDIMFNNEKIWKSGVYDLSNFSGTKYKTKAHISKILAEGESDGVTLYAYVSGSNGWQKVQNFGPVPGIVQNEDNEGTVQFMATIDQSKSNKNEAVPFNVQIM